MLQLFMLFFCQLIFTAVTWWAFGASASFDHEQAVVLGGLYLVFSLAAPMLIYDTKKCIETTRALLLAVCGFAFVVLWLFVSDFPLFFATLFQALMTIVYGMVVLREWNMRQRRCQEPQPL